MTEQSMFLGTVPRVALTITAAIVITAAVLNAWSFSGSVATPLMQADAWYYLDHFIKHWLDGSLSLNDFFTHRSASDHIQPIQRLILLYHTKYFDMDFRIEGLIGVLFGVVFCASVASQLRLPAASFATQRAVTYYFFGAVFAIGLSINSTGIFTWPLVTLSFCDLLLCSLLIISFLRFGSKGALIPIAFTTFAVGLAIDQIAISALVASAIAAYLGSGWSARRLFKPFITASIALIVARVLLAYFSEGSTITADASYIVQFSHLIEALGKPDVWKAVTLPLANSVLTLGNIDAFWPTHSGFAIFAIASAMLALHIWFWWTTVARRIGGNGTLQSGFATALMLLSYALLFGVVLWRVPQFGWDYLNQPRYVVTYQLSCLALIVLAHDEWFRDSRLALPRRALILGLITASIAVQVPISIKSWSLTPYISSYWSKAAIFLGESAIRPADKPIGCPDIFPICDYDEQHREESLRLLKDNKLNVFSTSFQLRNRLYPSISTVPRPEPAT